jgi:O-antigen ligase
MKKYRPQLLLAFALGCTVTIIYLYFNAFATIRYYKLPLSSILSPAFTNHNFAEPIDMHATFFSLQIVLALVYMLSLLIKENSVLNKIFYGTCCFILLAGIIQLSSKSVFVALFLIINIAFPFLLLQGVQLKRFILVTASISVLIVIGIFNSRAFRDRYLTELRQDLSQSTAGETTDPRLARWEIAVDLVSKVPLTGYGAGSEIGLLQEKYFARKFYRSYLNGLNAHNEYLSFLIKSGVWGLAIYLATLVYGFKKAIPKKDILFFSFMMLMAIVSLSENILDADKGVIYYSFFFSFFVFAAGKKEKIQVQLKRHKYLRKAATNSVVVPSSL